MRDRSDFEQTSEVAVHDSSPLRRLEGCSHLGHDRQSIFHPEPASRTDALAQRLAEQEFHRYKGSGGDEYPRAESGTLGGESRAAARGREALPFQID